MTGGLNEAALQVALLDGLFQRYGVETQVVPFSSPSGLLAALDANAVDVGSVPVSAELFETLSRGDGIRLVAEAAGTAPGRAASGLLVMPELAARLRTPTDLRDRQIALPEPGGPLDAELGRLLRQGWLARGDVRIVPMPAAGVADALRTRSVDAAMLVEPWLSNLEIELQGIVWRRADAILPDHLTAVLAFAPRFARQNPDTGRRLLTGYLAAARVYGDSLRRGDEGRGELAMLLRALPALRGTGTSGSIVFPAVNPNGMPNIQTLRMDQAYFLRNGLQRREADLAASLDNQFAAFAISQLGEYR
jgi:NitT/TauT family transport system substrate-binding protein